MRICVLLVVLLAVAGTPPAPAELPSPREFGFEIPAGPVSPGGDELVLTKDGSGQSVVARVHVNVGEHRIVMLPDGELVARSKEEAEPTSRRFVPATSRQIIQRLQAKFPRFKTKVTRHYVYVYNTSENFVFGTSRILETMLPGVQKFVKTQRIETKAPEVPLVVILYRTEDEFRRNSRLPKGVVAFYDPRTNRITMYEESPLWKIKPELAIQEAISTIAHEGAHQILHNVGVQRRLSQWPMWLSEGLAEYLAPTTFGKELRWKGAGEVNDMRMFELEMYLKSRKADAPNGQMIEHTVSAAQLTSTGYGAAWVLTHYLAKNRAEELREAMQEASRLGPFETAGERVPPGLIPENLTRFKKQVGDDLALIESDVLTHLKKLPYRDPFAEWPHWVAFLAIPDGRRTRRDANLFHSPTLAAHWLNETLETVPAEQRASSESMVRAFPNRLAAEQHVRQFLGGQ